MGIQTALDAVMNADRLVDALRLADDLAFEASRDSGVRTIRVLRTALGSENQLVAIAATHALGTIVDAQADIALAELLSSEHVFLREHAAWVHGSRRPHADAIPRLVGLVAAGGFGGMLAQRSLEEWAAQVPDHVAIGLESALLGITDPSRRTRLVETLGLVRHPIATRPLVALAQDDAEDITVRVAAVAALGQRRSDRTLPAVLSELAGTAGEGDGYLADVARVALIDIGATGTVREPSGPSENSRGGLTIAQLFLHADIDAELSNAGSGDNGGIATLLVRLGDALIDGAGTGTGEGTGSGEDAGTGAGTGTEEDAGSRGVDAGAAHSPVRRVLTLSRGLSRDAVASVAELEATESGHFYGRIPLLSDPVQSANAWPLRVAARRGIRRMLRAAGQVDVLHLRMADVGSLAAFDVARELDIPVVFTVAPDPHAVINSLDLAGRLQAKNFGNVDEVEHFWFRTRLVQRLAANSAHTVLFPRPNLHRDMNELVGIDITAHPERHTIVPEGIDLRVVDRAVAEVAQHAASPAPGGPTPAPHTPAPGASGPIAELRALLEQLPPERRSLPLLVSVGRFHRVKGMATIVEAWAESALHDRANLLLIGGNLSTPSADEREQLELMDAIIDPAARPEAGLLLPGHRRNDTVARWVAAARFGVPGLAAPGGVYVCGSLKEEFGIALLEAMASGLLVVAPDGGGPATYVEHGVTGFLAPTWDVTLLRAAVGEALDRAAAEEDGRRAALSRATVEASFTIEAMARALGGVYSTVHHDEVDLQKGLLPTP